MNSIDPQNLSALEAALGSLKSREGAMVFQGTNDPVAMEKAMVALESIVKLRGSETDTGHISIYYDGAKRDALTNFTKDFIVKHKTTLDALISVYKADAAK